ncbi:hypothetical protein PsYK624_149810 [Phanerochaete sordida]|uniref:Uncharacterized protein n=1 Tax=Phanerochaete sordida TaxID=48140 RepID=A0A9P3GSL8_9APHY|nr:hypothetical protein PsYK624_149810 [Phanerochaete sordida]
MTSTSDVVEAARLCLQAVTAWRFDSGHPPGSDTLHDLRRDYHPETIESVSTALTDAEHIIKHCPPNCFAVSSNTTTTSQNTEDDAQNCTLDSPLRGSAPIGVLSP